MLSALIQHSYSVSFHLSESTVVPESLANRRRLQEEELHAPQTVPINTLAQRAQKQLNQPGANVIKLILSVNYALS